MTSDKESTREDAGLIEDARKERPEAFRRIIEKYQNDIFDLCLRMTGSRQDAEDITQEAFLKLYQHLARYKEGHKLSNWLYTIALNLCRSRFRKKKVLRFFSLDWPVSDEGEERTREFPSREALVDAGLEREEAERLAHSLVACLPDTLKAPFVLRYLKQMRYDEIARVLRLSMASVKVRLHRAKLLLWKRFGKSLGGL
ncbi:MAG: sigma-70 family RNA polymerase sigma factor [Elusimicrobia bacterium]|nr:sigma-70 family RNA polymerase sigma factor [Elusimicrobiota bacterium]